MRIGYISGDHGIPVFGEKGATIHVQSLANAFSALGHDVTILATRIGARDDSVRAEVLKVRDAADAPEEEPETTPESKRLAKERRYLGLGRSMEASIMAQHSERPFDFLYERYSLWSAAGVRAARRLRIPCVVEVNAPLVVEQKTFRQLVLAEEAEAIEREVFATADAVVTVSEEVRRYTLENGAPAERTLVVPNGVDTRRFSPSVAPASPEGLEEAFVVGFVGSLKGWHDIESLLEAFRLLASEAENYHLLIVGDGPLRPWADGYIRAARLDERVTITGWKPYGDMPGLVRRMDVAAAPYPQMDGFYFSPLKLYEYLAAGRPIVASAIGQVCDVIRDDENGLLVRPGDPADMAEKIRRLHDDPALRERLAEAAAREGEEHTWEGNARRMVELVSGLLEAA